MLRFPVERRLAAIRAEREAEEASEQLPGRYPFVPVGSSGSSIDVNITHCTVPVTVVTPEYVRSYGFFGVRLRPPTTP